MNDILNTILKDTYTLTQLNHRLSILKANLVENLFGSGQKGQFEAKDLLWLQSLPPAIEQNFDKDNVYSIFTELQNSKAGLKILTIYLTFEGDDTTLKGIGETARRLFGSELVLDVKYNPKLIAGAAFVWKGVYKDYSLRSKIEEKKEEILESFKKYLR